MSKTPTDKGRGPGRPVDHRLASDLDIVAAFARKNAISSLKDLVEVLSLDKDRVKNALKNITEPDDDPAGPVFSLEDVYPGRKRRIGDFTLINKRPRLTNEQADALCDALDRLGIARDNERRLRLESAVFPKDYVRPEAVQERMTTDAELAALDACATSIVRATDIPNKKAEARQPIVTFTYTGRNDEKAREQSRERHVIPLSLRLLGGTWQIDAFDLDNQRAQTFVAADMASVSLSDETGDAIISSIDDDESRRVNITCADEETAHTLLALNEARLEEGKDRLVVSIPYYRKDGKTSPGTWLPRHLIPLMGSISFENDELKRAIHDVITEDLNYARRRGCI